MIEEPGYVNYDAFADVYDQTRVIPPAKVAEITAICGRTANLKRGGLFLDAGVGTGRFGATMAQSYPGHVVGVDVSSEMLNRARRKSNALRLVRGDLLRLPFPDNTFNGVLIVHILHLVEQWKVVLEEARRVLVPGGVLFLGAEQGGHSVLVDYYLQQARARGVSTSNLGTPGVMQPISYLRRVTPDGKLPRIELLSTPRLSWRRRIPVDETLKTLDARVFSQMRNVDDALHRELMETTTAHSRSLVRAGKTAEEVDARFVLYGIWK